MQQTIADMLCLSAQFFDLTVPHAARLVPEPSGSYKPEDTLDKALD